MEMPDKRTSKQKARWNWSKAEFSEREEELEQCFPGYFSRKLTMQVFLGVVLFVRGFYVAMTGIMQIQSIWQTVITALGIGVAFLYYTVLIHGRIGWLSALLLVLRIGEFIYMLVTSADLVFYMNLIGICWWVVSVVSVWVDILFLIYLNFGKTPKLLKRDNRVLYSVQEMVSSEEMI